MKDNYFHVSAKNICGLTPWQWTLWRSSSGNNGSLALSQPQQQKSMDVIATCSGSDQCVDRQRELVNCLVHESVVGQGLDYQLTLDARTLAIQLAGAADAKERATSALFNATERLSAAFREHHNAVIAAEAAAHAVVNQRNVVRNAQLCVDNIQGRLAEAKSEAAAVAANSRLNGARRDFGVYATGCQPDKPRRGRSATAAATATSPPWRFWCFERASCAFDEHELSRLALTLCFCFASK